MKLRRTKKLCHFWATLYVGVCNERIYQYQKEGRRTERIEKVTEGHYILTFPLYPLLTNVSPRSSRIQIKIDWHKYTDHRRFDKRGKEISRCCRDLQRSQSPTAWSLTCWTSFLAVRFHLLSLPLSSVNAAIDNNVHSMLRQVIDSKYVKHALGNSRWV